VAVLKAVDGKPAKRELGFYKDKGVVIHDNFDDPLSEWEELTRTW